MDFAHRPVGMITRQVKGRASGVLYGGGVDEDVTRAAALVAESFDWITFILFRVTYEHFLCFVSCAFLCLFVRSFVIVVIHVNRTFRTML